MNRCTRNASLTPEEGECVQLNCSVNDAIMKLFDLENQIDSGKLVFTKSE